MTGKSKIYIFGASGSGTTTLGAHIAAAENLSHVDTDDHFWAPGDPPFTVRSAPSQRLSSMSAALGSEGWVLTGECHRWGGEFVERADLIVLVSLPAPVRLMRLKAREQKRFGDRINEGGDMCEIHKDFMSWARAYDDPNFQGRSRARQERWLSEQRKPLCRIDGARPLLESSKTVISMLRKV
mgnify:CR=1 FL=1